MWNQNNNNNFSNNKFNNNKGSGGPGFGKFNTNNFDGDGNSKGSSSYGKFNQSSGFDSGANLRPVHDWDGRPQNMKRENLPTIIAPQMPTIPQHFQNNTNNQYTQQQSQTNTMSLTGQQRLQQLTGIRTGNSGNSFSKGGAQSKAVSLMGRGIQLNQMQNQSQFNTSNLSQRQQQNFQQQQQQFNNHSNAISKSNNVNNKNNNSYQQNNFNSSYNQNSAKGSGKNQNFAKGGLQPPGRERSPSRTQINGGAGPRFKVRRKKDESVQNGKTSEANLNSKDTNTNNSMSSKISVNSVESEDVANTKFSKDSKPTLKTIVPKSSSSKACPPPRRSSLHSDGLDIDLDDENGQIITLQSDLEVEAELENQKSIDMKDGINKRKSVPMSPRLVSQEKNLKSSIKNTLKPPPQSQSQSQTQTKTTQKQLLKQQQIKQKQEQEKEQEEQLIKKNLQNLPTLFESETKKREEEFAAAEQEMELLLEEARTGTSCGDLVVERENLEQAMKMDEQINKDNIENTVAMNASEQTVVNKLSNLPTAADTLTETEKLHLMLLGDADLTTCTTKVEATTAPIMNTSMKLSDVIGTEQIAAKKKMEKEKKLNEKEQKKSEKQKKREEKRKYLLGQGTSIDGNDNKKPDSNRVSSEDEDLAMMLGLSSVDELKQNMKSDKDQSDKTVTVIEIKTEKVNEVVDEVDADLALMMGLDVTVKKELGSIDNQTKNSDKPESQKVQDKNPMSPKNTTNLSPKVREIKIEQPQEIVLDYINKVKKEQPQDPPTDVNDDPDGDNETNEELSDTECDDDPTQEDDEPLGADWEVFRCGEKLYYHHRQLRITQWEQPSIEQLKAGREVLQQKEEKERIERKRRTHGKSNNEDEEKQDDDPLLDEDADGTKEKGKNILDKIVPSSKSGGGKSPTKKSSTQTTQTKLPGSSDLPVLKYRNQIVNHILKNKITIICGSTGSGKTTQIPQMLIDCPQILPRNSGKYVIVTSPRKIGATANSERIALERGLTTIGEEVGYQIRYFNRTDEIKTRLVFCTTAVVLRRLFEDPSLKRCAVLIVDEVHERDIHSEFLLTTIKDKLLRGRDLNKTSSSNSMTSSGMQSIDGVDMLGLNNIDPDLVPIGMDPSFRLVLMTATFAGSTFVPFFKPLRIKWNDPDPESLLSYPGRMFPIKEFHLEDILEWLGPDRYPLKMDTNRLASVTDRQLEEIDEQLFNEDDTKEFSELTMRNLAVDDFKFISIEKRRMIAGLIKRIDEEARRGGPNNHGSMNGSGVPELDSPVAIHDNTNFLLNPNLHPNSQDPGENGKGSILVFLPGWKDILDLLEELRKTEGALTEQDRKYHILPLHSQLIPSEQSACFDPAPPGRRKIILSTNIAETSLTISDVVYVINSGISKQMTYDSSRNTGVLENQLVSLANNTQRKGRAGRCQNGIAIHLYPSYLKRELKAHQSPEILSNSLEEHILQSMCLKLGDPIEFFKRTVSVPPEDRVQSGIEILSQLGAIEINEQGRYILTELGQWLGSIPQHPSATLAMSYSALFGCVLPCLIAISFMGAKSPFDIKAEDKPAYKNPITGQFEDGGRNYLGDHYSSDHAALVAAYVGWKHASHISEEQKMNDPAAKLLASKRGGDFLERHSLSKEILGGADQSVRSYLHLLVRERGYNGADCSYRLISPTWTTEKLLSEDRFLLFKLALCLGFRPKYALFNPQNSSFTSDQNQDLQISRFSVNQSFGNRLRKEVEAYWTSSQAMQQQQNRDMNGQVIPIENPFSEQGCDPLLNNLEYLKNSTNQNGNQNGNNSMNNMNNQYQQQQQQYQNQTFAGMSMPNPNPIGPEEPPSIYDGHAKPHSWSSYFALYTEIMAFEGGSRKSLQISETTMVNINTVLLASQSFETDNEEKGQIGKLGSSNVNNSGYIEIQFDGWSGQVENQPGINGQQGLSAAEQIEEIKELRSQIRNILDEAITNNCLFAVAPHVFLGPLVDFLKRNIKISNIKGTLSVKASAKDLSSVIVRNLPNDITQLQLRNFMREQITDKYGVNANKDENDENGGNGNSNANEDPIDEEEAMFNLIAQAGGNRYDMAVPSSSGNEDDENNDESANPRGILPPPPPNFFPLPPAPEEDRYRIENITIPTNPRSGESKGFAFLQFTTREVAKEVIKCCIQAEEEGNMVIRGRQIRIDLVEERDAGKKGEEDGPMSYSAFSGKNNGGALSLGGKGNNNSNSKACSKDGKDSKNNNSHSSSSSSWPSGPSYHHSSYSQSGKKGTGKEKNNNKNNSSTTVTVTSRRHNDSRRRRSRSPKDNHRDDRDNHRDRDDRNRDRDRDRDRDHRENNRDRDRGRDRDHYRKDDRDYRKDSRRR